MRFVLMIIALFLQLISCSQNTFPGMTVPKWNADLDYLGETINKKFALFNRDTKKKFNDSLFDLKQKLPSLSAEEIITNFSRIVALLNDGHTELNLLQSTIGFDRLPLIAWYFEKELIITHTDENHTSLLGARVKKIGSADVPTVREKLIRVLAHDNDVEYLLEVPNYMMAPSILKALGIIDNANEVTLTVENINGETSKETLQPIPLPAYQKMDWKRVRPVEKFPFYLQHLDKYYWFQYLEETGILYFKINSSNNQKQEKNLGAVISDFFDEYEQKKPAKVVIDLRLNRGGNYERTTKLAEWLKDHKELHEKGKLWVITDRYTFSAAVVLAAQIKQFTNALIIGEEARGNPNGSDNYENYTLPNSKISFGVTNRVKNHYPAILGSPYLPLDIPINYTFPDYMQGMDASFEYIKNYKN
jgi:hypothetical protein